MRRVALWIAAACLAAIAGIVGVLYTPSIPAETLETKYGGPNARFVSIDGTRVHVRDQGPRGAPVLLLVHGSGGSLHVWEPWVQRLADRWRLVSFDLPGHGLTGPSPGADYSIEAYATLVGKLADALVIDRFTLAGHSMGGMVAWFATAQPLAQRVTGLVLVDSAGYPRQGAMPRGLQLARMPVIGEVITWLQPRDRIVRNLRLGYGAEGLPTSAMIGRHLDLLRHPGNRAATLTRLRRFEPPDPKIIQLVKAPTLILWCAEDRYVDVRDARLFQRDIAGSELSVYEGCGHHPMEEQPDRSAADVRRFLEKPR